MRTRTLFALCFLLAIVSFAVADETRFCVQTATNSSGMSVTVWQQKVGCDCEVFAQICDSDGNPKSEEIWVSENDLKYNELPLVAINDSGSFVIAWDATHTYRVDDWWDLDYDVYARIYDSSGNPSDIFQVTHNTEWRQEVKLRGLTVTSSGKFVICWIKGDIVDIPTLSGGKFVNVHLWIQQFTADGSPLGQAQRLTDSPLEPGVRGYYYTLRELSATEEQITVVYRDNDRQLKTVTQYWADIKPTVTIRYQQEENPGEMAVLTILPTIASKKYTVYYCDSLKDNCWSPLGEPVVAEGNSLTVIDQGGATSSSLRETKSRFYKVSLAP